MKKLLVLGLCLIFASAYSQRVSVGLSLGAGKTSISNIKPYTGSFAYRIGGIADIKLNKILFIASGVEYNSYAIYWDMTQNIKNVEKYSSVDIPIGVKLKTGVKIQPYFSLAFGPSFLVSAKNFNKGVGNIPNSTTGDHKIDVSDNYNTLYWSGHGAVGAELKGEKITPFIEIRLKRSVSETKPSFGYDPLTIITGNIGFKF